MLSVNALRSSTVEVKGFHKSITEAEIRSILSFCQEPVDLNFSWRYARRGKIYATYKNEDIAMTAIHQLHQHCHNGSVLSVRYELGMDAAGDRIMDSSSHNTVIRSIRPVNGTGYQERHLNTIKSKDDGVVEDKTTAKSSRELKNRWTSTSTYSASSVTVDGTCYPFPSGLYLSRVLALTKTVPASDPLLDLLMNSSRGGRKQSKEISEVMAMVDCTERAIKRLVGVPSTHFTISSRHVDVFVVGDGRHPVGCAAMCLHFPTQWHYYSIDPLLVPVEEGVLGAYAERFHQFPGRSEDFSIPSDSSHEFSGGFNTTHAVDEHVASSFQDATACSTEEFVSGPSGISTQDCDKGGIPSLLAQVATVASEDSTGNPGDIAQVGPHTATQHYMDSATHSGEIDSAVSSSTDEHGVSPSSNNLEGSCCLSIVIACHSHAPLNEFWARVPSPKIAIVMPCCANYSDLPSHTPVFSFEDFEVYSPKRKISVFASCAL